MRVALLVFALSVVSTGLRAQEAVPVDTFDIAWTTTPDHLGYEYEMEPGARFVVRCAQGGEPASIWGTDTYTSDSAICVAAAHSGILGRARSDGVIVEITPGLTEYAGTMRNGIHSRSYAAWQTSFRFPEATGVADTPDTRIYANYTGDWNTTVRQLGEPMGELMRIECPPGGQGGNVWGTDIYTDDSSICEAAVHAGVITRGQGGFVYFELLGAQPSFAGSERNGVTTMSYPEWPGSFRFAVIEDEG